VDRSDATAANGSPVTARDPFLRVVRDCMTILPDALAPATLPASTVPTNSMAIVLATNSLADARRPTAAPPRATL
jgi:hypothetical protein